MTDQHNAKQSKSNAMKVRIPPLHAVIRLIGAAPALALSVSVSSANLNPVLVGTWPGNTQTNVNVSSVAVTRDTAVVTEYSGFLNLVGVADPSTPRLLGRAELGGESFDVATLGDYAYVGGRWLDGTNLTWGFWVIDISDPANPEALGKFDWGQGGALVLGGDLAYRVARCGVFQAIDVSEPSRPHLIGTCEVGGCDLVVLGNRAYVVSGSGLEVIDLSDPAHPKAIGGTFGWVGGDAWLVSGSANRLYLGGSRLGIMDVSDPVRPSLEGLSAAPFDRVAYQQYYSIAVSGVYAFAAGEAGLDVYDVGHPVTPAFVGGYPLNQWQNKVVVAGNHLFVANYNAGLQIFAFDGLPSTPPIFQQPQSLTALRGNTTAFSVVADPGFATSYQWRRNGLDLRNDRRIHGADSPRLEIDDVEFENAGDYTVVVSNSMNVATSVVANLRIRQPVSFQMVGKVGVPTGKMAVANHLAYIAASGEGLVVVDVSDPSSPQRRSSLDLDGYASDVAVTGNKACVAARITTTLGEVTVLRIVDISDAANPVRLGTYQPESGSSIWGVQAMDHWAYCTVTLYEGGTNWVSEVRVLDISDGTKPVRAGAIRPGGQLLVRGTRLYVVRGMANPSLAIYGLGNPVVPELLSASRVEVRNKWGPTLAPITTGDGGEISTLVVIGIDEPGPIELGLVDVADPTAPSLAARLGNPWGWASVGALGRWLFVGAWSWSSPLQLSILDAASATSPLRVGQFVFDQLYEARVVDATLVGDLAYMLVYGSRGPQRTPDSSLYVLRVDPVLRIPTTSLERTAEGGFRFKLSSETNQVLDVQASEDLHTWIPIGTVTNLTGSTMFTDPATGRNQRLYRLELKR